ncbi:MAG: hypothetical protein Q9166_005702 [cf. Caloplaca sp. 2 TL-2023]
MSTFDTSLRGKDYSHLLDPRRLGSAFHQPTINPQVLDRQAMGQAPTVSRPGFDKGVTKASHISEMKIPFLLSSEASQTPRLKKRSAPAEELIQPSTKRANMPSLTWPQNAQQDPMQTPRDPNSTALHNQIRHSNQLVDLTAMTVSIAKIQIDVAALSNELYSRNIIPVLPNHQIESRGHSARQQHSYSVDTTRAQNENIPYQALEGLLADKMRGFNSSLHLETMKAIQHIRIESAHITETMRKRSRSAAEVYKKEVLPLLAKVGEQSVASENLAQDTECLLRMMQQDMKNHVSAIMAWR